MKVDVFRFLDEYRDENFDLVFVDPPYAEAESLAGKLTAMLPPVLKPGATVVTESDRRSPLELASPFTLRSEHRYGDTLIRIFDAP
jgi:16S rRNA (guanine966-N2)-methyltransferase